MNCPNPPNRYNPADEPLWLVVQRDDRTNCFEFPPHTHKAIVVGSCSNSDVRISGIAPVAFFLEREGTSIWLTPAYAEAELRLDTLKVEGKRRIYTHGLVELADIELRLRVRDTPPTLRGDGLVRIDSEVSDPMSKRAAAAIDDLTATTAIESSTVIAALGQGATTTMPPASPIPDKAFATKTIEVDAFNFDEWFDDAIKESSDASVDTQPLEPVIAPSASTSAPAATLPRFARPPRPRIGPPNIKTQAMAPIQWPPEPTGTVEAP